MKFRVQTQKRIIKMLKDSRGMGVVGVMAAIGVFSVVALGVYGGMTTATRVAAKVQDRGECAVYANSLIENVSSYDNMSIVRNWQPMVMLQNGGGDIYARLNKQDSVLGVDTATTDSMEPFCCTNPQSGPARPNCSANRRRVFCQERDYLQEMTPANKYPGYVNTSTLGNFQNIRGSVFWASRMYEEYWSRGICYEPGLNLLSAADFELLPRPIGGVPEGFSSVNLQIRPVGLSGSTNTGTCPQTIDPLLNAKQLNFTVKFKVNMKDGSSCAAETMVRSERNTSAPEISYKVIDWYWHETPRRLLLSESPTIVNGVATDIGMVNQTCNYHIIYWVLEANKPGVTFLCRREYPNLDLSAWDPPYPNGMPPGIKPVDPPDLWRPCDAIEHYRQFLNYNGRMETLNLPKPLKDYTGSAADLAELTPASIPDPATQPTPGPASYKQNRTTVRIWFGYERGGYVHSYAVKAVDAQGNESIVKHFRYNVTSIGYPAQDGSNGVCQGETVSVGRCTLQGNAVCRGPPPPGPTPGPGATPAPPAACSPPGGGWRRIQCTPSAFDLCESSSTGNADCPGMADAIGETSGTISADGSGCCYCRGRAAGAVKKCSAHEP